MQRDMTERGHSLESIKASIEARKPDFDAYIGKPSYSHVRLDLNTNVGLLHLSFLVKYSIKWSCVKISMYHLCLQWLFNICYHKRKITNVLFLQLLVQIHKSNMLMQWLKCYQPNWFRTIMKERFWELGWSWKKEWSTSARFICLMKDQQSNGYLAEGSLHVLTPASNSLMALTLTLAMR